MSPSSIPRSPKTARRRAGEIEERANDYRVRAYAGRRPDGTRERLQWRFPKTKEGLRAAKAKAAEIAAAKLSGDMPRHSVELLGPFLDRQLAAPRKANAGTREQYAALLARYVKPILGHLHVARLRAQDIEAVLRPLQGHPHTHNAVLQLLRSLFRDAVAKRELPYNPCEGLRRAAQPTAKRTYFDDESLRRLVAQAQTDGDAFWTTWLGTGARPGELRALRWSDVDLARSRLTIRRAVARDGTVKSPKTDDSIRELMLSSWVVDALRAHRVSQTNAQVAAGVRSDLVFASEAGTVLDARNVRRRWAAFLRRLGLPHVRAYALRHSVAVFLLRSGRPINDVSAQLGHRNPKVTLAVYADVKLDDSARRKNAEALDALAV